MGWLVLAGVAPARRSGAGLDGTVSLGGFIGFLRGLIRSGAQPTLRRPGADAAADVLRASLSGAVAYAIAGRGRGAAFPILMVIMMFGMTR